MRMTTGKVWEVKTSVKGWEIDCPELSYDPGDLVSLAFSMGNRMTHHDALQSATVNTISECANQLGSTRS